MIFYSTWQRRRSNFQEFHPGVNQNKIHLVEFGGRGGVFQHTLALAQRLGRRGFDVIVHTAKNPELNPTNATVCFCFDWQREKYFLRNFAILRFFIFRTLPHLMHLRHGEVVWVQGIFKTPLTLMLIMCLRLCQQKVAFSPHALRARGRGFLGNLFLNLSIRMSNVVIVYNSKDKDSLDSKNIKNLSVHLYQYVPDDYQPFKTQWNNLLDQEKIKIGCIGQLRIDKNYALVISVADFLGAQAVIVGEDVGAATRILEILESSQGNHFYREEYLSIESLVGLLSTLDVVMLPYNFASQSGIAEISSILGVPVVSRDQGALGEQSAHVLPEDATISQWGQMILRTLEEPIPAHTERPLDELIDWLRA